jgi:predicted aspartyl protease
MEGEEVDREVSPPILNREKEQPDNFHGVNRELGNPPDTRSPEGLAREEGAAIQGYESSSKESIQEENNLVGRDMDESMEEESFPEQEGASVARRSQDDENGAVLEDNIGDVDTEEEEEGAVTVLKLSNGVMFRVPVEVQGMQLQAVVDTAAQVTLMSEEFYKSLDPAPPIRREMVMNTAGKGMQMNGYIAGPFQVVLGTHQFSVEIYVAPLEEEMLLGLDFLEANGVSLHLKEKKLQIAGEEIPMSLGAGSPLVNEKEKGVSLVRGCKIPPNSVMRGGPS